ncbi:MAG: response regulator [Flavobacteriales bacterium]
MIKVILTDDHKLFRSGIKSLLHTFDDFQVIAEAGNGQELLDILAQGNESPDVIMLDLEMPVMDGMETLKNLKTRYPDVKCVVLSMHDDEKFIIHMMELGARGYLLKNAEPEDIDQAIRSVAQTGYHFSDKISRIMLQGLVKKEKVKPVFQNKEALSEREVEVLRLICEELTAAEIAEKLFISPRTVEGHRNKLMEKTGAKNIAGLVVYAMKEGLYEVS